MEILLVEDNPGDVRLIEEAINSTERETRLRIATDGEEAVELLTQQAGDVRSTLPDLVFLDLNLPGRDGRAVLDAIRGHERLRALPVIILTSSENSDDVARCYSATANAYLTKPIGPVEYRSLVEAVERFWFERAQLPSR